MGKHNPILDAARKEEAAVTSTTATPNLATPPPAPVLPSSKLRAVESALAESSTRIVSSIESLETGAAETRIATESIATAIGDITSAAQITRRASDTANLQAQNATISAFEASGGAEIQAGLMATLREDQGRVADLLDEKQDIIDDEFTGIQLVDGIINSFRSFQTDLEIDAALGQQTQTQKEISGITAATESFARANTLTKKTLNQGVIEANYRAIEAEGRIKASEVEIANINSNAAAMSALVTADSRNVSNLLAAFRLEGEAEERELKAERQVFLREQMTFQREQWLTAAPAAKIALEQAELNLEQSKTLGPTRIAAAERTLADANKRAADQIATEDQLVEAVQKGQSLAGTAIEPRETILFGLKQSGGVGKKYARLQELGGSPDRTLGLTPFDAASSVELVAPSGAIVRTPGILVLEQIAGLQAQAFKAEPTKTPKTVEGVKEDFNNRTAAFMEVKAADISFGDATNPYQAAPMPVLIESFSSITDTQLYKNVLKSMDMKEVEPQRIMDAAIAGIRAKSVSPEAAAVGVETIFKAAALYNNTMFGGFRRVGLPNQETYNAQIRRPATLVEQLKVGAAAGLSVFGPIDTPKFIAGVLGFGKGEEEFIERQTAGLKKTFIVDLMDATKVQEAIVKALSATVPPASTETTPAQ